MLARFKMKPGLRLPLELRLINDYGYRVHTRLHGHYTIYEKLEHKPPAKKPELKALTDEIQQALIKRINKVVDFYADPVESCISIRIRLNNMANGLPEEEGMFVLEWMDKYVPEVVVVK